MGNRFNRSIISTVLCASIALPRPSFAFTKMIAGQKGRYTVFLSETRRPKEHRQIVLGPDSSTIKLDLNGDGVWDHWELNKGNISVIANTPIKGHYFNLSYQYNMKMGLARADFIYDEKTKSYLMTGRILQAHKKLKAENIVIGKCSMRDPIARLAGEWNNLLAKNAGELEDYTNWIVDNGNNRFIDPSCKEGKFKDSYDKIKNGMAQVLQWSSRSEVDEKDFPGRYLQCMDHHGFGIHADRIRRTLFEKIDPQQAMKLYKAIPAPFVTQPVVPGGSGATGGGGNTEIGEVVANTTTTASETRVSAENSAAARDAEIRNNEGFARLNEQPLVRCEHSPLSERPIQRGKWDPWARQITLSRLVGDQIPSSIPAYQKDFKFPNADIPATKVGFDDYAKTFFHELLHASFIENESITEAIENCCSLDWGFDKKNPACHAMEEYMKKASGQQSFIYAMTRGENKSRAYASYHQALIDQVGEINEANRLEGNVIYRFKTVKDQCDSNGKNCKTVERSLFDKKAECVAAHPSDQETCTKKFNREFYQRLHSIYKTECTEFDSPGKPLNCSDLATDFLNIFGDCKPHRYTFEKSTKWQTIFQILMGEANWATASQACDCFEIASNSFKMDEDKAPGEYDFAKYNGNPSQVRPGKDSSDYADNSKRPVTPDMYKDMKVIPKSQINKDFIQGYERSSSALYDSAVTVFKRIRNEILPTAHASSGISREESSLNHRLSASYSPNSPVRIADPFQSRSAIPVRDLLASNSAKETELFTSTNSDYDKSSGKTSTKPSSGQSDSDFDSAYSSSQANSNSAVSSISTTTGGSKESQSLMGSSPEKLKPVNGSDYQTGRPTGPQEDGNTKGNLQNSSGRLAAADLPGKKSEEWVASDKIKGPSTNHTSTNTSANNSLNGASKNGLAGNSIGGSLNRQPASKNNKSDVRNSIPTANATTDELLKFLIGPYRIVEETLPKPEFNKLLIDRRVKVLNHNHKVFGSRQQPYYILQFNEANGALNVVKWK
jgi:hypothetical protein